MIPTLPSNDFAFSPKNIRAMWVISAVLFFLTLFLYTRGNSFPYYYHIDEPLKVEQLLDTGELNFHHPLLMINTTDIAIRLTGTPRTPQHVVVAGRWCNALFGAIAAVAFAWFAFHYGGILAGLAGGLMVALDPMLFVLTHYYKEDPALLMGFGLSFLGLAHFWTSPSWKTSLLTGAACAVAVSGKYIGIAALIIALPVILAKPGRLRHASVFLAGFIGAFLLINYQMVAGFQTMQSSLGREVELLGSNRRRSEGGFALIANDKYADLFRENTNAFIWFFIGWHVLRMIVQRRTRTVPEWIVTVFPFAYLLVISFVPKTAARYLLPASAVFCFLAGLGMANVASFAAHIVGRHQWKIAAAVTVILLAIGGGTFVPEISKNLRGFCSDSRRDLADWITKNVAPDAIIAQDQRVQLASLDSKDSRDRSFTLPQKVLSSDFVAELGTVDELRAQGVTYVAIQPSGHDKSHGDKKGRQTFDDDLVKQGELVWKCKSKSPSILHPDLEFYRLPKP